MPRKGDADYEQHREDMAAASRERSAAGREIGAIPDIANVRRRAKGRKSLRVFIETYNPEPLYFGWSADHLKVIARIEEAATAGALFALAMARGSGKTTLCRMAALWVVSYAIRRYAFLIGATDAKAAEAMDAIKKMIRFLPLYGEDFPEIAHPCRHLKGIAHRANGQTCGGESTNIKWAADEVVFPTVPPPKNWPKAWPLRSDGMVPTAGHLVSASGLTGEGIRGSLKTTTTGDMVRPDFVLLDDPQTPESAGSKVQNEARLRLVEADVLGMAGPGRSIAAVMPCTVIEPGDMVDELLDRSKHPLWRGERSAMLRSMPTDLAAWDAYFEVYARCAQLEPPDFTESNALYVANRERLDAGAEASWADRKEAWEVSAVQSAMHLYFRNRRTFWAEYQNRPQPAEAAGSGGVDAAAVAKKVTNLGLGQVPRGCNRVTAFVDLGADLVWWAVTAFDERFGGSVVAYGVYPEQTRSYFAKADPRPSLRDLHPRASEDAALFAALGEVVGMLANAAFTREGTGEFLPLKTILVDANWGEKTDLVYDFCRRSRHANLLTPAHGRGIGATATPMAAWPVRDGERAGRGWRLTFNGGGRHLTVDSNAWKSFTADRLRTPEGAAGAWRLFRHPAPDGHRLFLDHLTSEVPHTAEAKGTGRQVDEWKRLAARDNDWWDCVVGCAVAASFEGLVWSADTTPRPPRAARKRVKWSEKFKDKFGAMT